MNRPPEAAGDHGSRHTAAAGGRSRIGPVTALNVAVAAIEAAVGLASGSLALVSDAVHNASDCVVLVSTYTATRIMQRDRDRVKTFGYGRAEVLVALLNSVILLAAVAAIVVEAVRRILRPQPVNPAGMLGMGLAALAVNAASVVLLRPEGSADLNRRSAYLHLLSDVAFSGGVAVAAVVIWLSGWNLVDPLLSLAIAAFFARQAVGVAAKSVNVLMEGAPPGIDLGALVADIERVTGAGSVHDVHVWSVSSREHSLSAHISRQDGVGGAEPEPDADEVLDRVRRVVRDSYGISHQTIQIDKPGPDPDNGGRHPCEHCEPRLGAGPT